MCELTGDAAKATPHEEDVGAKPGAVLTVGNKVRSDDGNDTIPEPVAGCGQSNTARTDGQREDLANDDPGSGTPGGGEHGDVQTDEGDHGAGSIGVGRVVRSVLASGGANRSDNELHNDHTGSTVDQDRTTSKLLNHDE